MPGWNWLPLLISDQALMLYRSMSEYLYSAWFVDKAALPDDQDREWVACILIHAASAEAARSWGDSLAQDRATLSASDRFLRSFPPSPIPEHWYDRESFGAAVQLSVGPRRYPRRATQGELFPFRKTEIFIWRPLGFNRAGVFFFGGSFNCCLNCSYRAGHRRPATPWRLCANGV